MSGLFGDWGVVSGLLSQLQSSAPEAMDKAMRDEAFLLMRTIIRGFRVRGLTTRWPKLAPATIASRKRRKFKGTKPLIVTGALRRSIQVMKQGLAEYTIGVHANSERADIAAIHEKGGPKIPQRSFIGQGLAKWKRGLRTRIMRRYGAYLQGKKRLKLTL